MRRTWKGGDRCLSQEDLESLVGYKKDLLTVVAYSHKEVSPHRTSHYYKVRCDCGVQKLVSRTGILGATSTCGCRRRATRSGPAHGNWRGIGGLTGSRWSSIRGGARRRGIECSVTMGDAWAQFELQQGLCSLTGLTLNMKGEASLDRIDNTKGYVIGNIQWVHATINHMKWVLSQEDFIQWCVRVASPQHESRPDSIPQQDVVLEAAPNKVVRSSAMGSRRGRSKILTEVDVQSLVGERRGFLTVESFSRVVTDHKRSTYYYIVRCDCGKAREVNRGRACRMRSCGCGIAVAGGLNYNWGGCGAVTGTYWKALRGNARTRDIPVLMTLSEASALFQAQYGKCALSGVAISFTKPDVSASLDRIDSSGGYVTGNVQWVHKVLNHLKWNLTQGDFLYWCKSVSTYAAVTGRATHRPAEQVQPNPPVG